MFCIAAWQIGTSPVQLRFMQQISYSGMVEFCKYECL